VAVRGRLRVPRRGDGPRDQGLGTAEGDPVAPGDGRLRHALRLELRAGVRRGGAADGHVAALRRAVHEREARGGRPAGRRACRRQGRGAVGRGDGGCGGDEAGRGEGRGGGDGLRGGGLRAPGKGRRARQEGSGGRGARWVVVPERGAPHPTRHAVEE